MQGTSGQEMEPPEEEAEGDVMPMDEGADAADLTLKDFDEDGQVLATGKRGPTPLYLFQEDMDDVMGTIVMLKKRYTLAMATRAGLENKYDELSLFWDQQFQPWEVEERILREALMGLTVVTAVRLAKVLKGVRQLVNTWDELWRHWFIEDFPEVLRDFDQTPETMTLPDWIIQGKHKDDDRRYANMPHRRYYAWWTFMRRTALRLIADIQSKVVQDFIRWDRWKKTPIKEWPLNLRVDVGVGFGEIPLPMPSFFLVTGGGPRCYAYVYDDRYYFLERMFLRRGGVVHDADLFEGDEDGDEYEGFIADVREARSPVFWLIHYASIQPSNYWNEIKWQGRGKLTMPGIFYYDRLGFDGNVLNFDYAHTIKHFCGWYAAAYRRMQGLARHHADRPDDILSPIHLLSPSPYQQEWMKALVDLPAAPMVDRVWFVGKPLCVGCSAQGEPTQSVCCKRCGNTYCSQDCQAATWEKNCAGCAKPKQ